MGMYDNLHCEYPLPVEGANAREYQTKDTPSQYLYRYCIKADGRLCHQEWDADTRDLGPVIWDGNFTGEIRFYDDELEFSAYLREGVLRDGPTVVALS